MINENASFFILTRGGIADPGQEADFAAIEARLAKPSAKLLVHLHGGLVDEKAGLAAATRLAGRGSGSWDRDDQWTQIYVIWRTGAIETLATNWADLAHNDRLYQALLSKLIRFVARRLGIPTSGGARSIGETFALDEVEVRRLIVGDGNDAERGDPFSAIEPHFTPAASEGARATILETVSPLTLANAFEVELGGDQEFLLAAASLDAAVNAGLPGRDAARDGDPVEGARLYGNLSASIKAQIGSVGASPQAKARGLFATASMLIKHGGRIAWRCFERFRTQRDHGFHATLVEELCRELYGDIVGATIWGMMTRDAAEHFETQGFGTSLLGILSRIPRLERFILSGHSAGSIWAAHMLLAMQKAGIDQPARLSLLAPAIRQDLFAQMIATAEPLISSCHMAAMDDVHERKDALLGSNRGYIYPHSLLYCVSGLFENNGKHPYPDAPILGMRRFGDAHWMNREERKDAKAIADFFARPGNAVMLTPKSGVSNAISHGSFDDDPLTLSSVAELF